MKKYDLYLDESGAFRKGQESLIGGFLCERDTISRIDCEYALNQIKASIVNEITIRDQIPDLDFYQWKHCCKNNNTQAKMYREEIQYKVLNHFYEFLEDKNAKPVIFRNDSRELLTDSTTTYLSVFAKGILLLLKKLYADNKEVELKIHVAQRMDTTARHFEDETIENLTEAIFEVGPNNRTILKVQYRKTLEWFLKIVLDSETYVKWKIDRMISEMEILVDHHTHIKDEWYSEPNDYTVVCDYICNSYFAMKGVFKSPELYRKVMDLYSGVVFNATSQNVVFTQEDIHNMIVQGRIFSAFEIVCLNEAIDYNAVKTVINRVNLLDPNEAIIIIDNVMDGLKKLIADTGRNNENERLLNRVLSFTELLEDEMQKIVFEINIRIYLIAVLTHLSKTDLVNSNFERSIELLDQINEVSLFEKYGDLLYNRRLVFLTDCFDYDSCENLFSSIDQYYKNKLKLYNGRSLTSISYGRIVGSYVQMLAAKMRLAKSTEDRELLYEYGEYYVRLSIEQFDTEEDLSRAYQNYCMIDLSAQRYGQALHHLLAATNGMLDSRSPIQDILQSIKKYEPGYQYLLYLYIKIMSESLFFGGHEEENRSLSSEMYKYLCNSGISYRDEENIRYYPRHVILWKMASYYALTGKKKEALKHYQEAYDLFVDQESEYTMLMISFAVIAEEIYMLMTYIKDENKEIELRQLFTERFTTVMEHKPEYFKNIFEIDSIEQIRDAEDYLSFSKRIAY